MDSRWLGVIVLIIIVALGGWYVFSHPSTSQAPSEVASPTEEMATTTESVTPVPVTVLYTDQGFSPSTVTITEGQTVMWINQSSHTMWVASAMHPTHLVYDNTSKDAHCAAGYAGPTPFDECTADAAGASYSFTFGKAGSWKYHDHANSSMFGTVVVTAPATSSSTGVSASTSVNVL
jgi:plastocyanin